MRRTSNMIAVFCTVLVLGIGLFMPHFTSQLLDYQLERQTTQREDAQISLVLSQPTDFLQTLSLFRDQQFKIALKGNNPISTEGERNYQMTVKEVQNKALEIMEALSISSILKDESIKTSPEVTPFLIMDKFSPSLSGIFWRCYWLDTQEVLWLDDKSGQMVAFQKRIPTIVPYAAEDPFDEAMTVITEYCHANYPLDGLIVSWEADQGNSQDYTLVFIQYGNETSIVLEIPIRFRRGFLYFNR